MEDDGDEDNRLAEIGRWTILKGKKSSQLKVPLENSNSYLGIDFFHSSLPLKIFVSFLNDIVSIVGPSNYLLSFYELFFSVTIMNLSHRDDNDNICKF